ncbi:MAG: hypothetical protein RLY20_878 [Verrucomicrobiota bacterium]|jgi:hypothetical protein
MRLPRFWREYANRPPLEYIEMRWLTPEVEAWLAAMVTPSEFDGAGLA